MEQRAQYHQQNEPAPTKLGYIARLKHLIGTLDRANQLLIDIVGPPLDAKGDVGKEPNSLAEALSAAIWDAESMASTVVKQLERLHEDLT